MINVSNQEFAIRILIVMPRFVSKSDDDSSGPHVKVSVLRTHLFF